MKIKLTILMLTSIIINSWCQNNHNVSVESFDLSNVKITKGPFYKGQQADLNYILALDPDRLLAPFLKDAGFKPIKENYGNWENSGLDGHIGGHYLSALSLMYATTGNKELMERIKYMINWLRRCQEKNGNGYVGGIPDGKAMWKEISEGQINAGTFSLNDRWVPLYNIHKLFAGLIDVYNITKLDDAKLILIKLTDWFYETTKNLSDKQIQTILISEHGGLNEAFVDVANITGESKYMEMAKRFSHKALLDPLLAHKNELTGLHANTQIPKVIGFEKYAQANNDKEWANASEFFWETVTNNWTISIGGNSVREHFHPANDFTSMIESEEGPETCNTYNMLKLTRLLFLSNPDEKYINYYERALFNHILSSQHPEKGGFVYFTPMRPMHYRVYSQPQTSFWCCVGSGLENPGKYGEMIYCQTNNDLYVNLFIASELEWKNKDVKIIQETEFPYEASTKFIVKTNSPVKFNLKLRLPQWITENFEVKINDEVVDVQRDVNGYVNIEKLWKNEDTLKFSFEMKTYAEFLPDSSSWVSFLHGPIVLGAITDSSNLDGLWADDSRMGHVAMGPKYPLNEVPAIILENLDEINSVIKPIDSQKFRFSISNLENTNGKNLILQPFYEIHESRYILYWPVYSQVEYEKYKKEIVRKELQNKELENRTIDLVWPGEQQPESDHFVKFQDSETGVFRNRHWRHAAGFFSYQFKNPGNQKCLLRITYYGGDKDRKFNILVNNKVVAKVELDGSLGDNFVDVDYPISKNVIEQSKSKLVEIKFVSMPGSLAGGIYGVRLMKTD